MATYELTSVKDILSDLQNERRRWPYYELKTIEDIEAVYFFKGEDFVKMLDDGTFLDNGKTGKSRLVLCDENGPVQPRELLEFSRVRRAYEKYLQAVADRRNENVKITLRVKICKKGR